MLYHVDRATLQDSQVDQHADGTLLLKISIYLSTIQLGSHTHRPPPPPYQGHAAGCTSYHTQHHLKKIVSLTHKSYDLTRCEL